MSMFLDIYFLFKSTVGKVVVNNLLRMFPFVAKSCFLLMQEYLLNETYKKC